MKVVRLPDIVRQIENFVKRKLQCVYIRYGGRARVVWTVYTFCTVRRRYCRPSPARRAHADRMILLPGPLCLQTVFKFRALSLSVSLADI